MKNTIKMTEIAKMASKIKVNKKLNSNSMENAPFFKKKMEMAIEILAEVGLPK